MITDKNFSLRLLKAVLKRGHGLSDHNIAHPEREWLIGLSIALLMLLVGIAWSVKLYLTFADIKFISIEPNSASEQVYRGGDVARALEALDGRRSTHESIREQLQIRSQAPSFIRIDKEENDATVEVEPEQPTIESDDTQEELEGDIIEVSQVLPDTL